MTLSKQQHYPSRNKWVKLWKPSVRDECQSKSPIHEIQKLYMSTFLIYYN